MLGADTFCWNMRSSTVSPWGWLLREAWILEPLLGPRPSMPDTGGVSDDWDEVTSTV